MGRDDNFEELDKNFGEYSSNLFFCESDFQGVGIQQQREMIENKEIDRPFVDFVQSCIRVKEEEER